MKKLMLVMVAVAFATMAFGCSPAPAGPSSAGLNIPEWFMNPPKEPGKAIYGTGVFTMDSIDELQLAKNAAAAAARREIAESMRVTLQGVLKNYMRKIQTPSGKSQYEQLTQDVSRQIVDNTIHGAAIEKQEIRESNGKYIFFSLVRIGFDGVAKALSDATKKEFEEVEENAAAAFAEMDELLTKNAQNGASSKPYMASEAPTPQ